MRPESRKDFTIAIICALLFEAEAVEALFDQTYDRLGRYYSKHPHDRNAYINGRIGNHNVVLCYMPEIGKASAASVASSLQISYPGVQLALVVGICAGAPKPPNRQEIYRGDVIIGDSVVEYDFGKQYPGGFQRKLGLTGMIGRPNREIRALLVALKAENTYSVFQNRVQQYLDAIQQTGDKWHRPQVVDSLFRASYHHKHHAQPIRCSCPEDDVHGDICDDALEATCDDLGCDQRQVIRCREFGEAVKVSTHIGTVASADTVMKSAQHRDDIAKKEKVIGFETEGAGVWDNISCMVIRGVYDYADSHKSKSWQAYAAATGASAAKAFLEYWRPRHRETSKTRHFMVPFGRNRRFVGRQDEIHKMEELISMPNGPRNLAITGLGGIGKTQIALELAYHMHDREAEVSIFWIPCTSHEAIDQACMTIAQKVGIHDVKPEEAKDRLKAHFSQRGGKWILIYDNADDMDMWIRGSSTSLPLKDFLPSNDQGHVIFTTRNRQLAVKLAAFDTIPVRELDAKSCVEFMEKSLVQKSLLNDSRDVAALVEQLTFLPLAITQAAVYINKNGIAVSDYLLLLQEQEADVVELLSEDFDENGRYEDVQNSVARTWLVSFHQIQKLNPLAAEYLSLMACLNPRNIPRSLLPKPTTKKKMFDALGLLDAYSFITLQSPNGAINFHPLVHLATRNWLKKEEQFPIYISKAAERLEETFPYDDHTNRQLWREYLPHILFLLGETTFEKRQEQYIGYIHKVETYLSSDGRHDEAAEKWVRVVEITKQVLGPEHSGTLRICSSQG
ncbi:putative kinesin light chain [Aspergillus terreus]|uniref:Putative kinesin light chain n=1 Tax=Aspergillus terreus TaxID=33178 RepID=A0A5M3YYA6_ASPTE|nr:hypothetical protein ATETN484_0004040600 [Aspergillus terreus]GFF13295.1 putative kinesin light chain [Aspergillus terreus]